MAGMNELATICSLTAGDAEPPAESGSALPVGWARDDAPALKQEHRTRVGRRAGGRKKCGACMGLGSAECFLWLTIMPRSS